MPESILIVDDEPVNLALLSEVLRPAYRVLAANSGAGALAVLDNGQTPDLILLDVMMPDLDGYQVLKRLRAGSVTASVPVIFVTALGSLEDERRGLHAGAVDYISKPFDPATVLARVRTQLELKAARDRLRDQNIHLEAELERRQRALGEMRLQAMQAEKLAAVGRLAAGVAHEINNPLAFVLSNLNALRREVQVLCEPCASPTPDRGPARLDAGELMALIDESLDGLQRVRGVVKNLREFAGADPQEWRWADANAGLEAALGLLRGELAPTCQVATEYGVVPEIFCNPAQLNIVYLNLLINAIQALDGQGDVVIRTGTDNPGRIWITIRDTGCGIPEEHRHRLFEPFFTTRAVGRGAGLGLAAAHGIVRAHQGTIRVESDTGRGTTVRLELPVQPEHAGKAGLTS